MRAAVSVAVLLASFVLMGCPNRGGGGVVDPYVCILDGPPTLADDRDPLPGIVVEVLSVTGNDGAGTPVRAGDTVSVRFRVTSADGRPLDVRSMAWGDLYVSGPSSNYQRVVAPRIDVAERAVPEACGEWRYDLTDPFPGAYQPPPNDTASFGSADGEDAGAPLADGTYTAGIDMGWDATAPGGPRAEAGGGVLDFLVGSATDIEAREVVTDGNCGACHGRVRAHGGRRVGVRSCVLCHVSGAEDRNDPSISGGTPATSIDFRVMVHKIHDGRHLPSVVGVATKGDGARDYAATPRPYVIAGSDGVARDFSSTDFGVWPAREHPMPADSGWTALPRAQRIQDDAVRSGAVACGKCHADPDGPGPLPAPAQGDRYVSAASKRACSSCHDDYRPDVGYVSNGRRMGIFQDDRSCALCHGNPSGGVLYVPDAHRHPLDDPAVNAGLRLTLSDVTDAGAADGDGILEAGEAPEATLSITDDAGTPIAASALQSISAALSGPDGNPNLLLSAPYPLARLPGAGPYRIRLPRAVPLELVGRATAALGDVFTTASAPHWNVTAATTTVYVRTGASGGDTGLSADAGPLTRELRVFSTTGFAKGDTVVLEDGVAGAEEYASLSLVETDRLWLASPARWAHASGSRVRRVVLSARGASDVSLDPSTGTITELKEFGAGNPVLVTYTTDFTIPATYPPPLNDTPDLSEADGEWTGLPVVSGRYRLAVWAIKSLLVTREGESQTYTVAARPALADVSVGSTALQTVGDRPDPALIAARCESCHGDLAYHGGSRRGAEGCFVCHESSGTEDLPRYVSSHNPPTSRTFSGCAPCHTGMGTGGPWRNCTGCHASATVTWSTGTPPETTGVSVEFRSVLHRLHRGRDFPDIASFSVQAYRHSNSPYRTSRTYSSVRFPVDGGVATCEACHLATDTRWRSPPSRVHPSAANALLVDRAWKTACGGCHDGQAFRDHVAGAASGSSEGCEPCHGVGTSLDPARAHATR